MTIDKREALQRMKNKHTNTSHRTREQRVHLILHLLRIMQQVLLLVMQRERQRRVPTPHARPSRPRLPHRLVFPHHRLHHLHDLAAHHRRRHIHHELRWYQLRVQRVPLLRLTRPHRRHLEHALDELALLRLDGLAVDQLRPDRVARQRR